MKITVSNHALQRCIERLGCSKTEARALLTSPAVHCAAKFGARIVRCARCRIVLAFTPVGATILTVLPIGPTLPNQLVTPAYGGPMPICHDPNFHPEERNGVA